MTVLAGRRAGTKAVGASRRALLVPPRRLGWPKTLPCLLCERPRQAEHAGDRLHATCRTEAP
jgi:hypothetical protein